MNPFSRQAGVAMRLLTLCVCLSSLGLASCTPKAFQTLVPLYRILHEGYSVDHCVTAGPAERDHAVANDGYVDEGVMGFVYSVQQPGTFEKGVRPLFSNSIIWPATALLGQYLVSCSATRCPTWIRGMCLATRLR